MPDPSPPSPQKYVGHAVLRWAIRVIAILIPSVLLFWVVLNVLRLMGGVAGEWKEDWGDWVTVLVTLLVMVLFFLRGLKWTMLPSNTQQVAEIVCFESLDHDRVRITCLVKGGDPDTHGLTFEERVPPYRSSLLKIGGRLAIRVPPDTARVRVDWSKTAALSRVVGKPAPRAVGSPALQSVTCPRCGAGLEVDATTPSEVACTNCQATLTLRKASWARGGRPRRQAVTHACSRGRPGPTSGQSRLGAVARSVLDVGMRYLRAPSHRHRGDDAMSRQRTAGEDDYLAFKARMVAIRRVAVVLLGLFGVVLLALGLLHVADVHLPGRGWLGVLSVVLAGVAFGSIVVTRHVLRSHALKRLPLRRARIVGLDFGESAVTLAVDTAGGCTCVTTSIGGLTDSDTVEFGQELAIRLPPHLEDPFIDWLETHRLFPRPLPLIATIESVQRQPENQAVLSLLVEGPDGLGLSLSGVCLQVGPVNQHWLRRWNELAVRVTSGGVIVDWTATSLHHRSGGLRPEPSPEERRAQAAARETQRCAYRVAALTHAIEQLDDKCGIYRTGKLSMTAVASMALLVGIIGTIFSTVLLRPWLFAQQGVWVFAGSSFVVCTAIGAPLAWTEQVFNKRARQAQVPALEQQLASLKKERDGLERHETHGGPFR